MVVPFPRCITATFVTLVEWLAAIFLVFVAKKELLQICQRWKILETLHEKSDNILRMVRILVMRPTYLK